MCAHTHPAPERLPPRVASTQPNPYSTSAAAVGSRGGRGAGSCEQDVLVVKRRARPLSSVYARPPQQAEAQAKAQQQREAELAGQQQAFTPPVLGLTERDVYELQARGLTPLEIFALRARSLMEQHAEAQAEAQQEREAELAAEGTEEEPPTKRPRLE